MESNFYRGTFLCQHSPAYECSKLLRRRQRNETNQENENFTELEKWKFDSVFQSFFHSLAVSSFPFKANNQKECECFYSKRCENVMIMLKVKLSFLLLCIEMNFPHIPFNWECLENAPLIRYPIYTRFSFGNGEFVASKRDREKQIILENGKFLWKTV